MATTCTELRRTDDVPELVPARMLNEFCYCPRLAYLEWVQGEFADNLETREGRFKHRRVDQADRREVPEPGRNGDEGAREPDPAAGAEGVKTTAQLESTQETEAEGRASSEPAAEGQKRAETIHSRSIMLSAPVEGLIARIDVLDLQSGVAVPVDYKRGKVPDVPGGAWEPEQV